MCVCYLILSDTCRTEKLITSLDYVGEPDARSAQDIILLLEIKIQVLAKYLYK